MKVNGINAYFNKENLKNEAKAAGISGALSAGLTLAFNKGQNPKNAAIVGLFAAGVSVAIGAVQKAVLVNKIAKENTMCESSIMPKTYLHNG